MDYKAKYETLVNELERLLELTRQRETIEIEYRSGTEPTPEQKRSFPEW